MKKMQLAGFRKLLYKNWAFFPELIVFTQRGAYEVDEALIRHIRIHA
ncbi:MAG: hypothetical protein PHD73_06510 [Sediminibacterium sp.]|nr:hypothetical protein [Sediminibacterium sp.]